MIKINNLTKVYGNQIVLNNMNCTFPDKGLVCILGASGCGKSTLLNIIAGFDSDYSGEITVCGTSISQMSCDKLCEYRRDNIGFIFQNYNLLSGYTVLENVLLASELSKDSKEDNRKKAENLLIRLNISEKANEKVENLSGGQKQRACIARALMSNPQIILADEPTGALDRKNSTEIMELLKEISKERLVLVITHDKKICEFADNSVLIKDGNIVSEISYNSTLEQAKLQQKSSVKISSFAYGVKNFKVNLKRYIAISIAISIGILAFMISMSSANNMKQSITQFKEKNTAFNNGYIIGEDDGTIFKMLQSDKRIENIYYQYKIKDVNLRFDDKIENIAEKRPIAKSMEDMSYGIMPRNGKNQIAINTSLAKKFLGDISNLIGKQLVLTYDKIEYKVIISGIFNASYDDFIVSSDIEKSFYKNINNEKNYSISYDVKEFDDIVAVSEMLAEKEIKSQNVSNEVKALQNTFANLSRLFMVVSILVLTIGLFISIVLLVKLQNSRYKEIGLLSALGFSKNTIRAIITNENILLSILSAVINTFFVVITYLISGILNLDLIITIPQICLSTIATGIIVVLISFVASYKLINTQPAVALKK